MTEQSDSDCPQGVDGGVGVCVVCSSCDHLNGSAEGQCQRSYDTVAAKLVVKASTWTLCLRNMVTGIKGGLLLEMTWKGNCGQLRTCVTKPGIEGPLVLGIRCVRPPWGL